MTNTGQKMLCGGEKMEQKLRRDCDLGDNLRRLRNASGLSQGKLCAELQRRSCGIGRTTYAKYEAGELNVRVSVLLALKRLMHSQRLKDGGKKERRFPWKKKS